MSKPIHHEITFRVNPHQIYEALSNAKQFSEFTAANAEIDPVSGGLFSCFDGMITGRTIENIPDTRLIQAWRVSIWDAGIYSIARFEFEKINNTETKLVFDHTGFPDEQRDHLNQGWHDRYWEPLKKYLNA